MKTPEDFGSDREYETYRSRRSGRIDFLMSTGLILVGFGSMILIMVLGK